MLKKLWLSESFTDKRTVLKLAFVDKINHVRNDGLITAKTTLPFKVLSDRSKNKMVPTRGLEPPLAEAN